MYNEHSHRISTEKDRNLLAIYSTAKVPKTTLCLGQGRKVWFPPFSNFSFQTIKGTPDWPLGSTSLHLSINAADTSALISKTTKRGQGKGLISGKKVQFWPLFFFFFINVIFCSVQFKVHGWGKLFLQSLFVSFSIFHLFSFLIFFFFYRKKQSLFSSSLLWSVDSVRLEPFCLASVASGTAFPGHWSGFCSGGLLRRCLCEPCPWERRAGRMRRTFLGAQTTITSLWRPDAHNEFYSRP